MPKNLFDPIFLQFLKFDHREVFFCLQKVNIITTEGDEKKIQAP